MLKMNEFCHKKVSLRRRWIHQTFKMFKLWIENVCLYILFIQGVLILRTLWYFWHSWHQTNSSKKFISQLNCDETLKEFSLRNRKLTAMIIQSQDHWTVNDLDEGESLHNTSRRMTDLLPHSIQKYLANNHQDQARRNAEPEPVISGGSSSSRKCNIVKNKLAVSTSDNNSSKRILQSKARSLYIGKQCHRDKRQ